MAAVAPMDLVVKSEAADAIPLRCSICPKKPNFSDLSHLLTHISSKSHLAHRFKVELRARADHNALEAVRQYDDWCERYGINALLAERMAAKEQKKTIRRGRTSNVVQKSQPGAVARHQPPIKADPEDYYTESLATTGPYGSNGRIPVPFQNDRQEYFDNSVYQTPNLKRSRSDLSVPNTPDNMTRSKYRRWPSETETADSVVVSEVPSESTEFLDDENDSKLKGVKYPGMGLFDSADEAQKRMRNQKKDDSVLKQMKEASSGIEPMEFVWTEDGEFQRIRDIYAEPSIEGSPDRKFEERETHRRKRGRVSARTTATAPNLPRQKPSSTRVTRQMASRLKSAAEDDSLRDHNDNEEIRVSSHSHGSIESYDIFRDPPKPSPTRTESSLAESQAGFELRRRPALQPLNSNLSLVSPVPKAIKTLSYFSGRDHAAASFTSQPPVSNSHYFQHQHAMGLGTFNGNPLCAQTRGGYYNTYGYQTYGNEPKPPTTNFQAINTMNMGTMSFNAFAGPFASDSAHERVDQDFDL